MKSYCYMTLLTSDDYLQGVILLNQSLKRVNSKYPLVCLVTPNLSPAVTTVLKLQGITTDTVESIPAPEIIYEHNKEQAPELAETWKDVCTKFNIWRYTQFDKIIFLDADLFILKNLDHCFKCENMTGAIDGEYFSLWPNYVHLNSGFFVAEPDIKVYSDMMRFIYSVDPKKFVDYLGKQKVIGDQDVINEYYNNWPKIVSKHLNKYYNIFAPYIMKEHERDIIDNGYFIHFVGCKPWKSLDRRPTFMYDTGRDLKSKLFYEVALGIISYVYKNEFKNIDWDNESNAVADEIIGICLNLEDIDAAKKIAQYTGREHLLIDVNTAETNVEKIKILREFIVYLYDNKLFNNAYIFEMLNQIDRGNQEDINMLWNILIDAFKDKFGAY